MSTRSGIPNRTLPKSYSQGQGTNNKDLYHEELINKLGWISLILAVLSITVFVLVRTVGSVASEQEGAVSRVARPGAVFWGEPIDVDVRISADALPPCPQPVDVPPIYAVMVLDHSGSMAGGKMNEARNGASDFVDLMDLGLGADKVAVVAFDEQADLIHAFSSNRRAVRLDIERVIEDGGTNIADGLLLAGTQFRGKKTPPGTRLIVILLSDGQSNTGGDPVTAASNLKARGIQVVSIALGGDADPATLRQIASSPGDYYETADPANLLEIYGKIAEGLVGTAATDATLVEYYNDQRFRLNEEHLYRATVSGSQLTWQLPFIGRSGRSAGYFLEPRALGVYSISPTPGQVDLTDCNGQPYTQTTPTGPQVLVLFPVWLLYIFPILTLLWLIWRLYWKLGDVPKGPVEPGREKGTPQKDIKDTIVIKGIAHNIYDRQLFDDTGKKQVLLNTAGQKLLEDSKETFEVYLQIHTTDYTKTILGNTNLIFSTVEGVYDANTNVTQTWRQLRIEGFDVSPENRRRGIDKLLLQEAEAMAQEYNYPKIYAVIKSEQDQALFENHGYQLTTNKDGRTEAFKMLPENSGK